MIPSDISDFLKFACEVFMFGSIVKMLKKNFSKKNSIKHSPFGRLESLHLETFEERVTPTVTPVLANGVISGNILLGQGTEGVSGVQIVLTGTTTTGRDVNVSTTTNTTGGYAFDQLLPGSYKVSRGTPSGFFNGTYNANANVNLAESQSITQNLEVAGITAPRISMGLWSSGTKISITPPTAGTGTANGFTMPTYQTLGTQTLTKGQTSYVDLAGFFADPDTTNTTVNFNTSTGNIAVTLLDNQAPISVTNFLNYVEAGKYGNDLFHRMANLSGSGAPQIIQGGQFTVNGDPITGFSDVSTYQPIQNESNDTTRPNAAGTLAMARTSVLNSATSQFYFNITDNTTALAGSGGNGTGYAVFGKVADAASLANLNSFTSQYTAQSVNIPTSSQPSNTLPTVPVLNGVTPSGAFPIGAPENQLATITDVSFAAAPTGKLTYTVSSSNTAVVTATLGTLNGSFSPNQLQLVAGGSPGNAVVTLNVTDNRGETIIYRFNVVVQ